MADYQIYLSLFLVIFSSFSCFSYGYRFVVGGGRGGGWVVNPSENYNHWAERMRFQVNDTLAFKYDKALDSVLTVTRDDYDRCNTGNPIKKLDGDGNSTFKFDRSGPFYFISGNQTNCNNGQKLFIVVMAVRNRPTPPANAPIPAAAPPQGSSSPSPAPALSPPEIPSHAPAANGPSGYSTTAGSPGSSSAGSPVSPPPPRSFAVSPWDPLFVLISAVSLVFSLVLV